MEFKLFEKLQSNGNVRFVKTLNEILDLSVVETIAEFTVPAELANKAWAVAEIIYGDVNRTEELLHYNRLSPFDIKAGTIIKIPNLSTYPVASKTTKSKVKNASQSIDGGSNPNQKSSKQSISITGNGKIVFSASNTK